MSLSHTVSFWLWITPAIVEGLVLAVIILRKLGREMPWFVVYLVYDLSCALALWPLVRIPRIYIPLYWLSEALNSTLVFLVIYEIYKKVLDDYPAVWQVGRLLFRWSAVVLICFAILSAISTPASEHNPFTVAVLTTERSVRIVQAGLLLFLFLFASFLRLNWKDYVFGIALGFALSVTAELAVIALRVHAGAFGQTAFALLKAAAYNCAVMVWIVYLVRPRKAVEAVSRSISPQLFEWNHALADFLNQ